MKSLGLAILVIWPAFLMVGCKDKAEEQTMHPPPIDTTSKVDNTTILAADTMAAVVEAPGMPPAPRGNGYVVQVASGTDENYVQYLVDLWKGRGYEPFVSTITHDNETHYRVRLGLFQTQSEAKKVVAELADKYSLETWIDQVSN